MATLKNALYSLLLVSIFILGAIAGPGLSCPAPCEKELQWTLYARQIGRGANANQEEMVHSVHPTTGFGAIVVNNWDVLDAPLPNATIVARARGTHTKAGPDPGDWFTSLSIVFEGARFNGSTFQVMGISNTDGQWAIVGGTNELSRADGTIDHTVLRATADENYRRLDIRAFYTPPVANVNGIAVQ
ncbi:hypothetical protein ZWY2020_059927 [Hordeum vulgare]|nr:hypothetical protein ZWY2020_059927 [Hordeum vulgare]